MFFFGNFVKKFEEILMIILFENEENDGVNVIVYVSKKLVYDYFFG